MNNTTYTRWEPTNADNLHACAAPSDKCPNCNGQRGCFDARRRWWIDCKTCKGRGYVQEHGSKRKQRLKP